MKDSSSYRHQANHWSTIRMISECFTRSAYQQFNWEKRKKTKKKKRWFFAWKKRFMMFLMRLDALLIVLSFVALYSSQFVLILCYSLYLWKVFTFQQFTFIYVLLLHVIIAELMSSNDTLHQKSSCQERESWINCANAENEVISNDWLCRDQMSEVLCMTESIKEVDSRS